MALVSAPWEGQRNVLEIVGGSFGANWAPGVLDFRPQSVASPK